MLARLAWVEGYGDVGKVSVGRRVRRCWQG